MAFYQLICCLALLLTLVQASPLPDDLPGFTRRDLTATQVQQDLGSQLSAGTLIFGPSDSRYENATERWQSWALPDIEVVVQVAQESDIPKIVKYCNSKSIEFLTVNRGHSLSYVSMKKFKGVQIDVKQLTGIQILPGKKSARLQAGTYGINVIKTLWDQGYITATGAHECVGYTGLALGGGHGRYEGIYGLASDNIISMKTVLADGREIVVDKDNFPDLYWGMRGAGHNFGIVTSLEVKIFPRKVPTWHYHNYFWSGDQVERVFTELNKFHNNGSTPVKMGVNFGSFNMNPKYSNTSATLFWTFAYDGPATEAERLLAPFNAIPRLDQVFGDVPYTQIPTIQGTSFASGGCAPTRKAFEHALLQTYNVTNERMVYDLYNTNAKKYPSLALPGPTGGGATVLYEGYSTKAVETFPDDSSAYAWRHEYHIVYFVATVREGSTLGPEAMKWAQDIKASWNQGRKEANYINYSNGDESLESIYGYEPWRLQRLRTLKKKYDPMNRFRFHVPVNPE